MKKNCWEIMQCGREPEGAHVKDFGACPATLENKLDGVHGGKNAGRSCWVISGTFCGGERQGTFVEEFITCEQCEFYQQVKGEEYPNFQLVARLLKKKNL